MNYKCLNIEPYGVHSLRFSDILLLKTSEAQLDIVYPLINKLIKLKLIKGENEKYNQHNQEVKLGAALISAFSESKTNKGMIVASSYNGHIFIIESDQFICIREIRLTGFSYVDSIFYEENSILLNSLDYEFTKGNSVMCTVTLSNDTQHEVILPEKHEYLMESFKNTFFSITMHDELEFFTINHFFSNTKPQPVVSIEKGKLRNDISYTKINEKYLVILYSSRILDIYKYTFNEESEVSIKLVQSIIIDGMGCIGSFGLCGNKIYIPTGDNTLSKITIEEEPELDEPWQTLFEKQAIIESAWVIQNMKLFCSSVVSIEANETSTIVGFSNESGIFFYSIDLDDKLVLINESINQLQISGCGIALNHNGKFLAVGDLESNVSIFNLDEKKYTHKVKLAQSIRSLAWSNYRNHSDPNYLEYNQSGILYIGLMQGGIYSYNLHTGDIRKEINIKGTITCLKVLEPICNMPAYLLASSSKGAVSVFEVGDDNSLILYTSFFAHEPDPYCSNERFGSLPYYAEVWSICFNQSSSLFETAVKNAEGKEDNDSKQLVLKSFSNAISDFKHINFATVSEDQSLKVFNLSKNCNPQLIFTDKRHHLASTSVSWKSMAISGDDDKKFKKDVIATAGDDRTIHIYMVSHPIDEDYFDDEGKKKNNDLINYCVKIESKHLIPRWHTITYLSLEENGDRVASVTQNGYLILWRLKLNKSQVEYELLFNEKVNCGGIEGLVWKQDILCIVGSDLNILIVTFNNDQTIVVS